MAEVKQEQKVIVGVPERDFGKIMEHLREKKAITELIRIPYSSDIYGYETLFLLLTEGIPMLLKKKGAKPYCFTINQRLPAGEGSGKAEIAFFESTAEKEEDFLSPLYYKNSPSKVCEVFMRHSDVEYIEVKAFY